MQCSIGFNSCYHLTDVPAFVSGKYLVYFDPHCTNLDVSAANPGVRADFCASELLQRFPDQCRPFLGFGCTMAEPFQGTLFRFALRTPSQAKNSRLSSQVWLSCSLSPSAESGIFTRIWTYMSTCLAINLYVAKKIFCVWYISACDIDLTTCLQNTLPMLCLLCTLLQLANRPCLPVVADVRCREGQRNAERSAGRGRSNNAVPQVSGKARDP